MLATTNLDSAPSAVIPDAALGVVSCAAAPHATAYTQRTRQPNPAVAQTFDIDCTLDYEVSGATDFIFQIHAHHGMDQQVLSESLVITPDLPRHVFSDPGIGHRFMRLHAESGPITLRYRARVRRTVQPLDSLAQELLGHLPRGLSRVQAVVDWIHQNINYQIGTSNAMTTARDVLANRTGVCRDFAHLGVTFCRALNIPARLVVGYARFDEPPPDFHAVFEAYLSGQWVMFDATYMSPIDNLVRVATGRDAKDVAFATIYGPATMLTMAPLITPAGSDD
jgi:transglutaminase-like putative cysteine protease